MNFGRPSRGPRLFGEFRSPDALERAIRALRREAYHDLDAYAPYDVPGLDDALGARRSWLGWLALVGGVAGMVVSYLIQWYTNAVSYPLIVGGRPQHAVPAFVPATFEGTVLMSALAAFFGLLLVLRLPKLWAPEDEIDGFGRGAIDRFWLSASTFASDHDREHAEVLMREAGAQRVVRVER